MKTPVTNAAPTTLLTALPSEYVQGYQYHVLFILPPVPPGIKIPENTNGILILREKWIQ
jgi:hypothetical protein